MPTTSSFSVADVRLKLWREGGDDAARAYHQRGQNLAKELATQQFGRIPTWNERVSII